MPGRSRTGRSARHRPPRAQGTTRQCALAFARKTYRSGDFVPLHLITSLHAMRHIADALPADQRPEVVRCYWTGIPGVLFSRGRFPGPRKLAALHSLFETALDDLDDPRWALEWDWTVARAVEEAEEHHPKLVHVMREMWHRSGGRSLYRVVAGQFTATPELPATFEQPPVE